MKRYLLFLVILGVFAVGAQAQPGYFEVPDVPTDLPTVDPLPFLPWDIVENNLGVYNRVIFPFPLPFNTPVGALHQMAGGIWLLSVEVPTDLGGITWDRREVFRWDPAFGAYATYGPFIGAVPLIPLESNVDAVYEDHTGAVVVSFDVPTTIAGNTYMPSDLVRYDSTTGSFDPMPTYFPGIPRTANLTAADRQGRYVIVFSLGAPTTVGGATVLPGELLSWDGVTLAVFDPQPGWPANRSAWVNGLTFDPPAPPLPPGTNPGEVPPTLTVELAENPPGTTQIRLRWQTGDCDGGENHGVYQGTIASVRTGGYDHTQIDCNDDFPYLQEDFLLSSFPGDLYFLVVAHNGAGGEEGSYGQCSPGFCGVGDERPLGTLTCAPVQALGCP